MSPNFQLSPIHPPIGTIIDGGSLQLVEVLGVGGYGVVYRAVETQPSAGTPKSYAVKCLVTPSVQSPRSRQVHIREIALHQLASRHQGVVTLHRVAECLNLTYIILDYAPDHDLFTQILHSCRYLGDDAMIKNVFLQLLDAVEHCHQMGIYHRDLKPENILCYDDGLRIAITDFGLATTEKLSDEFRTGSVFHMSPECQGAAFAPQGNYSPKHNDIWSLGIILLNLATGRNPWKSATADDPTFQAYIRNPSSFLPSVLPISGEINKVLVGMLAVDYRRRTPLQEVRKAIQRINTFYSEGVIFEGSMARCPWESGMDIDTDSSEDTDPPLPRSPSPTPAVDASCWSKDTTSDIIFARPVYEDEFTYDAAPWTADRSSCGATWAYESHASANSSYTSSDESEPGLGDLVFDRSQTPSESSIQSPVSSLPATPNSAEIAFGAKATLAGNRKGPLKINTNIPQPRFDYGINNESINYSDATSAIMHTAIEYDSSSMFYLTSAISESKVIALPTSAITATTVVGEDKEMISPSVWQASQGISSPSIYSRSSSRTSSSSSISRFQRPSNPAMFSFLRSGSPSPELASTYWSPLRRPYPNHHYPHPHLRGSIFREVEQQSQHLSPIYDQTAMTDIYSPLSPPPSTTLFRRQQEQQGQFPSPPSNIPIPVPTNSPRHNNDRSIVSKKLIEGDGVRGNGSGSGSGSGIGIGTKRKPTALFKFFPQRSRSPSPSSLSPSSSPKPSPSKSPKQKKSSTAKTSPSTSNSNSSIVISNPSANFTNNCGSGIESVHIQSNNYDDNNSTSGTGGFTLGRFSFESNKQIVTTSTSNFDTSGRIYGSSNRKIVKEVNNKEKKINNVNEGNGNGKRWQSSWFETWDGSQGNGNGAAAAAGSNGRKFVFGTITGTSPTPESTTTRIHPSSIPIPVPVPNGVTSRIAKKKGLSMKKNDTPISGGRRGVEINVNSKTKIQKCPHPASNSTSSPTTSSSLSSDASASWARQGRFAVGRKNRRELMVRSPRHWFMPGRFFASAGSAA